MHRYDVRTAELATAVIAYAQQRLRLDPAPLDAPLTLVSREDEDSQPGRQFAALLRKLAQAWTDHPPTTPLIAAGSTGTAPAASC